MADFQNHQAELAGLGVRIVALSADQQEDAAGTVQQLGLSYPVAHGLDPDAVSRLIGCYTGVREGRPHLQPAAFVLDPEGTVIHAVYSSGKVGRLTATDALTIVREKVKAAPS